MSLTSKTDVWRSITDPIIAEPGSAIKRDWLVPAHFLSSSEIIEKYSFIVVLPGTPPKKPPPTSM